jgi:hypothetical protein
MLALIAILDRVAAEPPSASEIGPGLTGSIASSGATSCLRARFSDPGMAAIP